MCEDEQLENYNRRDNLKILGFPEQVQRDSNGNSIFENYDKTINNVPSEEDNKELFTMKNYTSFACNRQMNRGGGSMIQIRDNIS